MDCDYCWEILKQKNGEVEKYDIKGRLRKMQQK